jgi:hypothetical protein
LVPDLARNATAFGPEADIDRVHHVVHASSALRNRPHEAQMSQSVSLDEEIRSTVPADLQQHLHERDGAAVLLQKLPEAFSPKQVAHPSTQQRAWELIGLFYFNQPKRRGAEALQVFLALYQRMLEAQMALRRRVHKGMPLLWAAECFGSLGYPLLRKRYLMLALCEDAVEGLGVVSPELTGTYFRLVWRLGMPDAYLKQYASECYRVASASETESRYPEWVLQQLDQDWLTEFPNPEEANLYVANTMYIKSLIGRLGDGQGRTLEELAEYVMQCMPGCRTTRRSKSLSTDYDIICTMEGFDVDFRSELGRYFVCECKDWEQPADFSAMAKFCRVLDSVKSKFGILFSKNGISGSGRTRDAEREQLKVFQDRGVVIIVIDQADLRNIAAGQNLVSVLRRKYERVRLDLYEQQ